MAWERTSKCMEDSRRVVQSEVEVIVIELQRTYDALHCAYCVVRLANPSAHGKGLFKK